MRCLKTSRRGYGESLRSVLPGHRAAPAYQQLSENGLNLGQEFVISKAMCSHELPLAVLIESLQVGGNGRITGVAQNTPQFRDNGRNTTDDLTSLDQFAALQQRSRERGSFERIFVQDFDEAGGICRQNAGLKVFGVVVGGCEHSDDFIADLYADLNYFEAATTSSRSKHE